MRWSSGFRDTLIFDGTARGPSGGLTARRVDGLRRLLFLLGLSEDLVVRAGSLEDCESVSHAPDDEPVAGVGYVALVAPGPLAGEGTGSSRVARKPDAGGNLYCNRNFGPRSTLFRLQ